MSLLYVLDPNLGVHRVKRSVKFSGHALQRIYERGLSMEEVQAALALAETIEEYPDDYPYPSRLLLGQVAGRPLHIVAATNPVDGSYIIITVYLPDLERWDREWRKRR